MRVYERIITYLLYWTVLQDFILSLFFNLTDSIVLTNILFYFKDIIFVILVLWGSIRIKRFKLTHWFLLLLYLVFIFIAAIKSLVLYPDIALTSILSSIRSLLLLPGFIIIGFGVKDKRFFKIRIKKFFIDFLFIIAIIGIIEFLIDSYIVSTIPFWKSFLDIGNFMDVIKGQSGRLVDGLPGNFYGGYGGEFFSQKRLVSLWGNPLTAAYVLSIPCVYCFVKFIENSRRISYLVRGLVFLISIILTYTRTIIILTILTIAILYFVKIKWLRKYYAVLIPVFLIICIINFELIADYIYDGSTMGHISAVLDSLAQLTIFGNGIATFGIETAIGTESTYITVLGQLGLIGGTLYIGFNIYIVYKAFRIYILTHNYNYLMCGLVGVILLISGFVSEQLLAFTTIAPYYITMGFNLLLFPNKLTNYKSISQNGQLYGKSSSSNGYL